MKMSNRFIYVYGFCRQKMDSTENKLPKRFFVNDFQGVGNGANVQILRELDDFSYDL